jgi:hypothetical protein
MGHLTGVVQEVLSIDHACFKLSILDDIFNVGVLLEQFQDLGAEGTYIDNIEAR